MEQKSENPSKKIPEYRVILKGGVGEIEEKKSRFICTIRPVHSESEASAFIEEIKKKYWDARHSCSAFVLGSRQELTRCSDDGEPSGTAGRPMLEVLLGEGLCDVAAVVTRYFGGTLLGTGGLVRAYTAAVKEGLAASETGIMRYGVSLRIETDYHLVGKIQHILRTHHIQPKTEYGASALFSFTVPLEELTSLQKEITEATNGQAGIKETGRDYFVCVE